MVPDGALGKIFGLQRKSGSFTITEFDINTGAPLDTVTVAGDDISVDRIRWGTKGLTIATISAVYVLSGSFLAGKSGRGPTQK